MFKKTNTQKINENDKVNVKTCENIVTITRIRYKNRTARIKKISKDEYIDLKSGEVKKFNHHKKRNNNKLSAQKSMTKLRDIINSNIIDPNKCRFLTLTYKNNMTDKQLLQKDFKKFIRKLKSSKNMKKFHYNNLEYIAIYEPQGRGAFHIHAFLIFDTNNVYIPNIEITKLWENGYTKTQKIQKNIDDYGRYFTSQITDMSVSEINRSELLLKELTTPKLKKIYGPRGGVITKRIIKGARYELLQSYSHLFSCSKGVRKPDVIKDIEYKTVKEQIVGDVHRKPDSSQTINVYDDEENKFLNTITTETFLLKNDKNGTK